MFLRQIRLIAACVAFYVLPSFSLNLSEILNHAWSAIRHFVWGHRWQRVRYSIRQCCYCQRYEILHDMGRAYSHYVLWLPIRADSPEIQAVFDEQERSARELEEIRKSHRSEAYQTGREVL